ncbi:hypothetical protein [Mammaliicoccus sp. G-M28]|uniref:hypothetical protein n=1 Tax=Mammaliicoccus sp. G-M28 TaxID=2898688 RepID=UPI001EFAF7AB|nr:hypothetical protein [Mammaliicoccus sp. G-M28]
MTSINSNFKEHFKEQYKDAIQEFSDEGLRWELHRHECFNTDPNEWYKNTMLEVLLEVFEERDLSRITKDEVIAQYYTKLRFCEYLISTKRKDYKMWIYALEDMKNHPHMPDDYLKWIDELMNVIVEKTKDEQSEKIDNIPDIETEKERKAIDFTNFL